MTAFIPTKTMKKVKALGLSEANVLDAFNNGSEVTIGSGKAIIKKYQGYEIGVFYARNEKTGEFIITHVWKRDRR